MERLNHSQSRILTLILSVILLLHMGKEVSAQAQNYINGVTVVDPGEELLYNLVLNSNSSPCQYTWNVTGGDIIISQGLVNYTYQTNSNEPIKIKWNCDANDVHELSVSWNCNGQTNSEILPVYFTPNGISNPTSILGSNTVCYGTEKEFTANPVTGITEFQWEIDGTVVPSNKTDKFLFPQNVGTGVGNPFDLSVRSIKNGCVADPSSNQISINSLGAPYVTFVILDQNENPISDFCSLDEIIIDVSVPSGSTIASVSSFEWVLPSGGIELPNIQGDPADRLRMKFEPNFSTEANIIFRTDLSCGSSKDYVFNFNPKIRPFISGGIKGQTKVCINGSSNTYRYWVNSVNSASTYDWVVTGGTFTSIDDTTIDVTWTTSGNHLIEVTPKNGFCDDYLLTEELDVVVFDNEPNEKLETVLKYTDFTTVPIDLVFNQCSYISDCSEKELNSVKIRFEMGLIDMDKNASISSNSSFDLTYNVYDQSSQVITTNTVNLFLDIDKPKIVFEKELVADFHHIEISSINNIVIATDIKNLIYLKAELVPDYRIRPLQNIDNIDYMPTFVQVNDRLMFSWDNICYDPNLNYEVQILKLNNSSSNYLTSNTTISTEIDWGKAITIQVNGETNLEYTPGAGSGYYIYRVRPFGNMFDGGTGDSRNFGPWCKNGVHNSYYSGSSKIINGSSQGIGTYIAFFDDPKKDLNWIHSKNYAEANPGEKGLLSSEIISYANGLNMQKQTQSIVNKHKEKVISHQVADFLGRPALQSIPIPIEVDPTTQNVLDYHQSIFMKGSVVYTSKHFDEDLTLENPDPVNISNNSPTEYYSDNNPDTRIPNAELYPFSRTIYYPDGTGRVKEVSSASNQFRINGSSGKTTKYIYSSASENELIQIFGDEAPIAKSIRKLITIDPNGVESVSFMDLEGKTLATALINNPTHPYDGNENLDGLISKTNIPNSTIVDYLNNRIKISPYATIIAERRYFSSQALVTIDHEIEVPVISDVCADYCETCDYELEFKVYSLDNLNYEYESELIKLDRGIVDCSTPPVPILNSKNDLRLSKGSYLFMRELRSNNLETSNGNFAYNNAAEELGINLMNKFLANLPDRVTSSTVFNPYPNNNILDHLGFNSGSSELVLNDIDIDAFYSVIDASINRNAANAADLYDDLLLSISLDDDGESLCESIEVPVLLCPEEPCDISNPAFEEYFENYWAAVDPSFQTTEEINGVTYLTYFKTAENDGGITFKRGELNDLIENLGNDGYDCEKVFNCFKGLTMGYQQLNAMNQTSTNSTVIPAPNPPVTIPTGYEFSMHKEFMSCIHQTVTGVDYHKLDVSKAFYRDPTNPSDYVVNSHKYIYYEGVGPSSSNVNYDNLIDYCSKTKYNNAGNFINPYLDLGNPVYAPSFCPPTVDVAIGSSSYPTNIYCTPVPTGATAPGLIHFSKLKECMLNADPNNVNGNTAATGVGQNFNNSSTSNHIKTNKTNATNECEKACDSKREAFEQELIAFYHHNNILIEGVDNYELEVNPLSPAYPDPDPDTYPQYIEGDNNPIAAGYSFCITAQKFTCLVDELVANCKTNYCVLDYTWNSNGDTTGYGTPSPGPGIPSQLDKFGFVFSKDFEIVGKTSGSCPPQGAGLSYDPISNFNCNISGCPEICFRWVDPAPWGEFTQPAIKTCDEEIARDLINIIFSQLNTIIENRKTEYKKQYIEKCVNIGADKESFKLTYDQGLHHYTLYYYDRIGNLIKTVPPKYAVNNTPDRNTHPNHGMVTDYQYNSLNQLIRQNTPDGNETFFYYNSLGLLRFSQNAQQKVDGKYSYSRLDRIGRVIEAGQSSYQLAGISNVSNADDANFPPENDPLNEQVVKTVYSKPFNIGNALPKEQRFLSGRVSYSYKTETNSYSIYSYDPHGNVEFIIQQIPNLGRIIVEYEYDLITGNVHKVSYQTGKPDQFFHRYSYDEQNRIKSVETSEDNVIWETDARYEYYLHGPISRTELGEDKLQGLDYVYTINGWLKAINHPSKTLHKDPAADGANIQRFAKDAYSLQLAYFSGDFNRASSNYNATDPDIISPIANRSLFNGNISAMATRLEASSQFSVNYNRIGLHYRYDELNRIKSSAFVKDDLSGGWSSSNEFATSYDYDANGNITKLTRNANLTGALEMDNIFYTYNDNANNAGNNKLLSVLDEAAANSYDDIEGQVDFKYDQIGNLIEDLSEEIKDIEWTATGKVAAIRRTLGSSLPELEFEYDALDNRIVKRVIFELNDLSNNENYYYAKDASGVNLAVYKGTYIEDNGNWIEEIRISEHSMFGSDRLGLRRSDAIVHKRRLVNEVWLEEPVTLTPNSNYFYRTLGDKSYELKNHLGNVQTVLSDRKLENIVDPNWVDIDNNLSITSNLIEKDQTGSPTDEYDAGAYADVTLEGNGYIVWKLSNDLSDNRRIAVGLAYNIGSSSNQSIDYSFNVNDNDEISIENKGDAIGTSSYPEQEEGMELKVARKGNYMYFFINEELKDSVLESSPGQEFRAYFSIGSKVGKIYTLIYNIETTTEILSATDYYPFGSVMPGRQFAAEAYRYGFNGMERDDEVKGSGNSYTSYWRSYDPRIGRWFSLDPLMRSFPHQSPYVAFDNNPIALSDPNGNCTGCPKNAKSGDVFSENGIDYSYGDDGRWTIDGVGMTTEETVETFKALQSKIPEILSTMKDNGDSFSIGISLPQGGSISASTNGSLTLQLTPGISKKFAGIKIAGIKGGAGITMDSEGNLTGYTIAQLDFFGWKASSKKEYGKKVKYDLDISISYSYGKSFISYTYDLSKFVAPPTSGAGGYGIANMQVRQGVARVYMASSPKMKITRIVENQEVKLPMEFPSVDEFDKLYFQMPVLKRDKP